VGGAREAASRYESSLFLAPSFSASPQCLQDGLGRHPYAQRDAGEDADSEDEWRENDEGSRQHLVIRDAVELKLDGMGAGDRLPVLVHDHCDHGRGQEPNCKVEHDIVGVHGRCSNLRGSRLACGSAASLGSYISTNDIKCQ